MKTKLDSNKATNASGSKFFNIFWNISLFFIVHDVCLLFLCFVYTTKVIIFPLETVIIICEVSTFIKVGKKLKIASQL